MDAKTAMLEALLDGEGYALDLIDRVTAATRGQVQLGQATVYPLLRWLESDGLAISRDGEPLPERDGRPRRYYALTAAGRAAAAPEAAEWEALLSNLCGWLERSPAEESDSAQGQRIRRAMARGVRSEREARLILLAAGSYGDDAVDGVDALVRVRAMGQLYLDSLKDPS